MISRQEKTTSYNNNRPYIKNKKEFALSNKKAYFLTGHDLNKILQEFQSKVCSRWLRNSSRCLV